MLTIQQVEEALEVSFATASKYVDKLQKTGLLRELTGQARNRVFLAETILRTIDDPLPVDLKESAR